MIERTIRISSKLIPERFIFSPYKTDQVALSGTGPTPNRKEQASCQRSHHSTISEILLLTDRVAHVIYGQEQSEQYEQDGCGNNQQHDRFDHPHENVQSSLYLLVTCVCDFKQDLFE